MVQNNTSPYALGRNIENLSENSTYKVGNNGSLVKSSGIAAWFRESFKSDSVRQRNQQAVDTLAQQLTAQYGEGAVGNRLTLDGDLASGKKSITGNDLKEMAHSVKMAATTSGRRAGDSIQTNLLLVDKNTPPQNVLAALCKEFPADMPVALRQDILKETLLQMAIEAPTVPCIGALKNYLGGQEVADAQHLLGSSLFTLMEKSDFIQGSAEGENIRQNITAAKEASKNLQAMQGAMRLFAATENGAELGIGAMPEPRQANCTWLSAPEGAKTALQALGVKDFKEICKTALGAKVNDTAPPPLQSFLRLTDTSIALGGTLFREELQQETENLYETLLPFVPALVGGPAEFAGLASSNLLSHKVTEFLQDPATMGKFTNSLIAALEISPGLQAKLGNCMNFLAETLRPGLVASNTAQIRDYMVNAFSGGVVLSGIGPVVMAKSPNQEVNPQEHAQTVALLRFIQSAFAEKNLAVGKPLEQCLQQLPAWRALTAGLPESTA